MKKQDIINNVLMHRDNELIDNHSEDELRDMYIMLTGDTEDRTPECYVSLMRFFVNKTHLHKGISRNLYAVHTKETDAFRAIFTLNSIYGYELAYPYGVIDAAYEHLIVGGSAGTSDSKILEMVDFLREHDAPAVYE